VAVVERTVAGVFRYELVAEDGDLIGDLTSEQGSWEIGDLVPCGGHVFEIRTIEDTTLHVRRVI
jgi:hypothetical protein